MKNFIVFFAIVVISIPSANAQLLKKLKDKVQQSTERAVERKVDEKIEQSTEAAVDSIFESPKKIKKQKRTNSKTKQEPQTTVFPGNILSGEAEYDETYIFSVTATIEVEDLNANLQKTTMKQGYGKEALVTEMEKNGDPIIIDMKNQSAILLDINGGSAQVMSLEWMQQMMGNASISQEEAQDKAPVVKKTGKTKTMNGYQCHEYNIIFDAGSINAWYAPDVKFEYQDYLRGMAKMFSKKKEENPIQLLNTDYGYVMEMTFFNNESKKQNAMKVIALSEKVRMISMDNFKIQKL